MNLAIKLTEPIGDDITVHITEIKGSQVEIGVEAIKDIPVHRFEINDIKV